MTNAATTPLDTYTAARKAGANTADACVAVMGSHPGFDFDDVVEMSWKHETGASQPRWQHVDGSPTAEALSWDRGHESRHTNG